MKLTVIIVNYNVCYYLEQCIDSVQRAIKGLEAEIYVVDNHSTDGSVDYLKRRFADTVTLIECNHNQGFAKANNMSCCSIQIRLLVKIVSDRSSTLWMLIPRQVGQA